MTLTVSLTLALAMFVGFTRPVAQARYDVIVRGGTLYDGTGAAGRRADVAIRGDRIAGVGDFASAAATTVIDAKGLAVAPGFINMLSWATESLLVDGRSQGDIRQGVTLEIFGEGSSMGPLNDDMKKRMVEQMGDIKFDITWTTLSEYLRELERRGVSHERGLVPRRDDRSRARDRPRRQEADAATARRDARDCAARRWKRARWASGRR